MRIWEPYGRGRQLCLICRKSFSTNAMARVSHEKSIAHCEALFIEKEGRYKRRQRSLANLESQTARRKAKENDRNLKRRG